jgi:hypothetical protein
MKVGKRPWTKYKVWGRIAWGRQDIETGDKFGGRRRNNQSLPIGEGGYIGRNGQVVKQQCKEKE